ncbi:MAG: C25 family cysteine peptidase [Thermodesulfovibrionales bacterium]
MNKRLIKISRFLFLFLIFHAILFFFAPYSDASAPAGYSEYYIPGDENIMGQVWADIGVAGGVLQTAPRHTIISVVAWSTNTTLYYDHWEDGYDFDPDNPATADETYTLANKGDSRIFESSNIPVNPRGVATYYDGRDRIYVAGGTVTVTRSSWEETDGTVFALAWEVYPVKPQMIKYIMPFGDDLSVAPRNYLDFKRVFALIQATKNNTVVTFDVNKDGVSGDTICITHNNPCTTTATQVTLNQGEVFLLDRFAPFPTTGTVSLQTGTVMQSTETLQVNYIVGDQAANFEARGFSAFPSGMWDNEYYAPVPTDAGANFPTQLYVYNPHSTALTINYQTSTTSGSFSVPAGSTRSFFEMTGGYVPQGSGVYLNASDVFWGVSTIDVGGQSREWGYPLIPLFLIGTEHFFGWAPGAYPPNITGNEDDSGIFITPVQDNTRVFVDRNNDGTVDYTYTLNRLQTQYVYDTVDGDMSNSNVWATGPISIAYGQNPDTSVAGLPSIDLGYLSFPGGDFIDKVLTVTKTANPVVVSTTAGATSVYTLTVNSHDFSVDSISVVDTLPANWQYVNNSAVITLADMTTLSGASANPTIAGQVLTWPASILGSMAENQTITITFTGQTTTGFAVGTITRNTVEATGTRTVGGATQTFVTSDFAFNSYGDITVTKTSSATDPLYPGDQFTYTVNVTNPSATTFTGVSIYDPIPNGVSYVAGSGSISNCTRSLNVRDEFTTQAYTNNNGSVNWAGNWTETDSYGSGATGATGGFVWITGGQLQFRYLNSNVRDEFTTDNSYGGNYGSANWAGAWTEENDAGTPNYSTGTIRLSNGNNRLEFTQSQTNDAILRTATVTGATSATINFTLSDNGIDAGETVIVEYRLDGGAYVNIGTLDGGTGWSGSALPLIVALTNNNSLTLRFRAGQNWNQSNDIALLDNVDISYNVPASASGTQIKRTADLSFSTAATLSFSYTAANLVAGDTIVVEASSDGTSFTTLETLNPPPASGTKTYNLISPTNYASANTTVRLRITNGFNATNKTFSVDNMDISYTTSASYSPPEFLQRAAGCSILPGNSITLTFNVTVDNPLGTGINEITNTAFINSNEIILPISASVTNLVVNPSSQSAEVGDFVWFDTNGDGIQDVGEPGLSNVEVTLKDWLGASIATTTTNNGHFLFTNIEPGNGYYIEVTSGTIPAGLQQSAPAGHSDNRTDPFNLTAGQSYLGADLGYRTAPGTAAIGDLVWSDPNSNSLQDPGEPGLSGVTVQLWRDTNSNGILETGGPDTLVSTTTTAANGFYLFANVPASGTEDYLVYIDGTQAALTGYTIASNARVITNLSSGSAILSADFGYQGTTYTIIDKLWFDADGDGVLDGGETGISLVTVDLLDASMNVIATTITDASGNYTFSGVADGGADYYIRISDTNGKLTDYYGTTASAIAGETQIINLTGNLNYTAAPNFGYGLKKTIGSTVFSDIDGDGILDSGEPGISGVTVKLYSDAGTIGIIDGGDAVIATLTTDANGIYLFTGLSDGNYIVSIEIPPAGYNYTGSDSDPGTPGHQQAANITGGSSVLTKNFGYIAPVPRSVSGSIWQDTDSDGTIDASETGLGSVTIDLMQGGTVLSSTTSASDGTYSFNNLVSGIYTVKITDTNGVLSGLTTTYEVSPPPPPPYDGEETVDLTSGNQTGINFGYKQPTPTLVTLSSFRAYEDNGKLLVEWKTSSELNTAGFYLFRLDESRGDYIRINKRLLPSILSSHIGGTYSLIDKGASPEGKLTYVLAEVEGKGSVNVYGPFTVWADDQSVIESLSISSTISPEQLGICTASDCSGKQRSSSVSSINTYYDNDGTLVVTNKETSIKRQQQVIISEDIYENYVRKATQVSNEKRARLKASNMQRKASIAVQQSTTGDTAKIAVTGRGLHYLDASKISSLFGVSLNSAKTMINKNLLALTNQGRKVSYLPADGGSGIYFYGKGIDSIYTKENIYWLMKGKGQRMRDIVGRWPIQLGNGTFTDTAHAEENEILAAELFTDPQSDFWVWDYVIGDYAPYDVKNFPIMTKGVAGGSSTAALTVNLQGFTNTQHYVIISLNGQQIGESQWVGNVSKTLVLDFPQTLLSEGVNTVEVKGVLDTGVPYSVFYVDSFDLSYQRLYKADGDSLLFKGNGNSIVTVHGFTNRNILVFDVTDPWNPALNKATSIRDTAGNYRVSLVPATPDTTYLAITPNAAITNMNAWADTPSNLSSRDNRANYIVIAPKELAGAANNLANYRQGKGFVTKVVPLEDIMDEFNYGISSPEAIHAFLTYAYQNWRMPPKYVVLAGDGSYDYKNNLGFGENMVPVMLSVTPNGLFPSDNLFADVDSDHLPEMAIGRLPVLTAEELQNMINKIISFESNTNNRVILLSDNADGGGDFPGDSDYIANFIPPQNQVVKVYLYNPGDINTVRQTLLNEMNNGAFLMNYLGHAGYDLLAYDSLLSINNLGSLNNLNGLPVLTAITCLVGMYGLPGHDTLTESLVLKSNGGAVATWSPTGLSYNSLARMLDEEFLKAAFGSSGAILGDVIMKAAEGYYNKGGSLYMLDIYNLLGDPALKLR